MKTGLGTFVLPRLATALLCVAMASCGGGGGGGGGSAPPEPAPTVTLSAGQGDIAPGGSATLTWSSTHATSCAGTGGWSGAKATSGSQSTPALSATATFTLTCTGAGGTGSSTTTVTVVNNVVPAAPQGIQAAVGDGSITVSWQSQVGSYFQGHLVSSNVYVSTHPHIDVTSFVESADSQVLRGRTVMLPVAFFNLVNGAPVYVVATDVANGVESGPSVEISVTPKPIPALAEHIAALDDTGVDACADPDKLNQPCPLANLPMQDADVGRDADARAGTLAKIGYGRAGFDFTKLDANGARLPNDATTWPCVRDNVTGLVWEVPGNSALTDARDTYTWYQPDDRLNGGNAGVQGGGTCGLGTCDTNAFVAALNTAALCGFHDWRMPTRRELVSVVDLSLSSPALDPAVFPHLSPLFNAFYWSSTVVSASASVGYAAWMVDVSTGALMGNTKFQTDPFLSPGAAMAVRADPAP